MIQIAQEALHACVHRIVKQLPVESNIVVPFTLLSEFAAHKQELLAGYRVHESQIAAQIGEFLPAITWHLGQQRALAVGDLVVGQWQNEIFGEGIKKSEGEDAVMVLAMHRVLAHVEQSVVHPAHVPLVAEAETADISRARHYRPRG